MGSILSKVFAGSRARQAMPIWDDVAALRAGLLHVDEFRDRARRQGYTEFGIQRLLNDIMPKNVEAIENRLEADIAAAVRHR